jgi:hypothetical protein
MSEFEKNVEIVKLGEAMIRRVYADFFRFCVASNLADLDLAETDYSTLSVKEIMQKIRDFLAQSPSDINKIIFLHYLADYPVSMCKRDVSPRLRTLIGFLYRFGVPDKQEQEQGAEKVSYDDLSELFERSKATIFECVNQTEFSWREFQRSLEEQKRIEAEAKEQLIQEEKARLRQLGQKKTEESCASERTPILATEEEMSV